MYMLGMPLAARMKAILYRPKKQKAAKPDSPIVPMPKLRVRK